MEGKDAYGNGRGLRLAASPDGRLIAVCEPGRVVVHTVADQVPIAEIGVEGELDANEILFAGTRLIVLSRSAAHTRIYVVDPVGPKKLGEASFSMPIRFAAVAGDLVLTTGSGRTLIIDLTKPEPSAMPLPVRGSISAAGAIGRTGFVIASGDMLEEWDGAGRKPLRRVRLGRALDPAFVGGHGDRVWMISRRTPQQVDVISLARSSSHTISLVAEARCVVANAPGDLLAIICGDTRSTQVVDLARRTPPLHIEREAMSDVAWLGADTLVLHPPGQPFELFPIARPVEPAAAAHDAGISAPEPASAAERASETAPDSEEADELPSRWTREEIGSRLAAWRDRVRSRAGARPEPSSVVSASGEPLNQRAVDPAMAAAPRQAAASVARPSGWRVEVSSWARSISASSRRAAPTFHHAALDELIARFELANDLRDAIILLYGTYLNGLVGAAPIDLAAVLHWDWDEAIGDGELARTGLVRMRGGRVALVPEVIAALDGRPPCTGTVMGLECTGATSGAIVAPWDVDVLQLSAWAAPIVGALLVPNPVGERTPRRFLREARIRGLVPLVPWTRFRDALKVPPRCAAILVEHAAAAAGLDLPVVATWPAPSRLRTESHPA